MSLPWSETYEDMFSLDVAHFHKTADGEGMANCADSVQTAPSGEPDLGLHCLLRPVCPKTWGLLQLSLL